MLEITSNPYSSRRMRCPWLAFYHCYSVNLYNFAKNDHLPFPLPKLKPVVSMGTMTAVLGALSSTLPEVGL